MIETKRIHREFYTNIKKYFLIRGVLAFLFTAPIQAGNRHIITADTPAKAPKIQVSEAEILKNSQISYRADGGFTGVHSYGVILSCVNGRISVLKTIHDPRQAAHPIHQKGSLDKGTYLRLWSALKKQKVFSTASVDEPKMDIAEEFTHKFEARAGKYSNEFSVHGIHRPEACQLFAIKSLIDSSTQMQAFIVPHQTLASR